MHTIRVDTGPTRRVDIARRMEIVGIIFLFTFSFLDEEKKNDELPLELPMVMPVPPLALWRRVGVDGRIISSWIDNDVNVGDMYDYGEGYS